MAPLVVLPTFRHTSVGAPVVRALTALLPRLALGSVALGKLLITSTLILLLTLGSFSRNGPPRGGNWANANAPDFSPRGPANGNLSQTRVINTRPFNPHAYGHPGHGGGSYGGGGGGASARGSGDGQWRDGQHVPGPANARVERELFGLPNDPSKQQTGINFAAYVSPCDTRLDLEPR